MCCRGVKSGEQGGEVWEGLWVGERERRGTWGERGFKSATALPCGRGVCGVLY